MNIQKATQKAIETGKEMYRESAKQKCSGIFATVKPTNSYDTCILIINKNGEKESCRNWNPTADDLIANDWKLT